MSADAAESRALQFVSFPIPIAEFPASTREALSLIAGIAGALEEGRNAAVHCRQGIGRSGLIAAGVLMYFGASPEQADARGQRHRGTAVPETSEQRQWPYNSAARRTASSIPGNASATFPRASPRTRSAPRSW